MATDKKMPDRYNGEVKAWMLEMLNRGWTLRSWTGVLDGKLPDNMKFDIQVAGLRHSVEFSIGKNVLNGNLVGFLLNVERRVRGLEARTFTFHFPAGITDNELDHIIPTYVGSQVLLIRRCEMQFRGDMEKCEYPVTCVSCSSMFMSNNITMVPPTHVGDSGRRCPVCQGDYILEIDR